MAAAPDHDPEIGSLNAHLNGEPSQAIVVTPEQLAIDIKTNVLAVMPHFYGRKIECPYEFLHEFCKLCGIQRRPAGSSEEDYRLRALPFALKGEANTWLLRLPPNSIRTWSDFRLAFLDYFFPATKTNALKKEIQGAKQEFDETLSQYWARFKGLLDACPNNRMSEAEIYSNFYEGMTPESKDLVNSASGGDFSRMRVSEAKRIIGRLIDAKKAYDDPRTHLLKRGTASSAVVQSDDKVEARIDKLEKAILTALEKSKQPAPPEKVRAVTGPEELYPYYGPPGEAEYQAQVSAVGSWNQNGSWNPGKQRDAPWRDHPNFRWADTNPNPPTLPPNTTYPPPPENQPNWSSRNQEGQNNWGNRNQGNQSNWSGRNQNNPPVSYVPPHQRGYQNNPNPQPNYQGNQGPNAHYNANQGPQGNFHPN